MVEVSLVKPQRGVLVSAYVGTGGVAGFQFRQLVSGCWQVRSGDSLVWGDV